MTRSPLRANGKPASALRADAGFTLIEVIVAIVLIGASLLTVVGAAAAAFGFQAVARQQQVATTIATKKMEEVRALPWSVISGGMTAASLSSGDPNVVDLSARPGRPRSAAKYALAKCGSELLTSSDGTASPEDIPTGALPLPSGVLNPYRVNGGATVDGIPYSWSTYITKPSAGDPYHATVCVTWTWKGAVRGTMIQSWIWSPQGPGCIGRPITAVGGPCVSVSATVPDGAISIDVTHPYDPNNPGAAPTTTLSFALAGATSRLILADKTTATASFTAATLQGSSTLLDERTIVTADDDAANGVATFVDTTNVSLSAIPTGTSQWVSPVTGTDFRIRYLAGTGRVSASAVPGALSSDCPAVNYPPAITNFIDAHNAVCALSSVSRAVTGGKWLETRFAIGDNFFVQPIGISNAAANDYKYGTYAIAGGGAVGALAKREMNTVFLIGGVPSSTASTGVGVNFKSAVELLAQDSAELKATPPGATSSSQARASLTVISGTGPECGSTLNPTVVSASSSTTYGCGFATTSASTAFLSTQTTQLQFSWTWTYAPGSVYDSCASSPCGAPRTVQATSPSVDVTLYVVRTYCPSGQPGKTRGVSDYSKCTSTTIDDRYRFEISISLGSATVTYDRQV